MNEILRRLVTVEKNSVGRKQKVISVLLRSGTQSEARVGCHVLSLCSDSVRLGHILETGA